MGKREKTNSWGIASLILGIFGILFIIVPIIGLLCSIFAVVSYRLQKKHGSSGVATAGLVMGIIGIVVGTIITLFFLVGILALRSVQESFYGGVNETDIEVMNLSCERGAYGWIYSRGNVKNNANKTANFVQINIELYDGDKWVGSDKAYPENGGLPAGGTDIFENVWDDDSIEFTRCEASITTY